MYGIDVSHYQKDIDWNKVKESGKEFAILKAMYETSHNKDEYFEKNYTGCVNNGIHVGAYIFIGSKSIENPVQDAQAFLSILGKRNLSYGVWIDAESAKLRAQGKEKIELIILREIDVIRNAGYEVGVYTNLDWYKNVLTAPVKKFPIWMARYSSNDNGNIVSNLSPKGKYENVVAWQYSSKGKVPGIVGNVDMDVDYGFMKRKTNEEIAVEVIDGKWGTQKTNPTRKSRLENAGYNYIEIQTLVNNILKNR
mgnify:CR=1 FL=1